MWQVLQKTCKKHQENVDINIQVCRMRISLRARPKAASNANAPLDADDKTVFVSRSLKNSYHAICVGTHIGVHLPVLRNKIRLTSSHAKLSINVFFAKKRLVRFM